MALLAKRTAERPLPSIDLAVPAKVLTATFALG